MDVLDELRRACSYERLDHKLIKQLRAKAIRLKGEEATMEAYIDGIVMRQQAYDRKMVEATIREERRKEQVANAARRDRLIAAGKMAHPDAGVRRILSVQREMTHAVAERREKYELDIENHESRYRDAYSDAYNAGDDARVLRVNAAYGREWVEITWRYEDDVHAIERPYRLRVYRLAGGVDSDEGYLRRLDLAREWDLRKRAEKRAEWERDNVALP